MKKRPIDKFINRCLGENITDTDQEIKNENETAALITSLDKIPVELVEYAVCIQPIRNTSQFKIILNHPYKIELIHEENSINNEEYFYVLDLPEDPDFTEIYIYNSFELDGKEYFSEITFEELSEIIDVQAVSLNLSLEIARSKLEKIIDD